MASGDDNRFAAMIQEKGGYDRAMPELPEVETVRSGLQQHLPDRVIVAASISSKQLRTPWPPQLCQRLVGCIFTAIHRRAKYLLFALTTPSGQPRILLCHLGMSGCLRLLVEGDLHPKHQHLLLTLDDGSALSYADPRRFGMIDLIDGSAWDKHRLLCDIGPEPLESAFDAEHLQRTIGQRRSSIKALLLNSHIVAGIGNIYACEALFDAEISPFCRGDSLKIDALQRLVDAIQSVLQRAIAAGGSTIRDFAGSDGKPGYFAHQFHCYGKEGQPCFRCKTAIVRTVQQGRSSFYCPRCQPD